MNITDKLKPLLLQLLAAAAIMLVGAACTKGDTDMDSALQDKGEARLNVRSAPAIDWDSEAHSLKVAVESNRKWSFKVSEDWITCQQEQNALYISVGENDMETERTGSVVISADTLNHTIEVRQLGWGKGILLDITEAEFGPEGGLLNVTVTTNLEVEAEPDAEWIYEESDLDTRSHPVVSETRTFRIKGNDETTERKATITFRHKNDDDCSFIPKTVTVTQRAFSDTLTGTPADYVGYMKVKIASAEVTFKGELHNSNKSINLSFDGKYDTYYTSGRLNDFPIQLTYRFEQSEPVEYLVYYPTDSYEGHLGSVDIEVLTDNDGIEEWVFVKSQEFGSSSDFVRVDFGKSTTLISAVRLTAQQTRSWMVNCREMEFYRLNPDDFDVTTLFTDRSCSELKAGITEDDIARCSDTFYRSLAYMMYQDSYPRQFRINTYKCYPHPDMQSQINKTTQYSLQDNMTGIWVDEGEELLVLAELHQNEYDVSLNVQYLKDAFVGTSYYLQSGANKLKMTKKGLVYVHYHYNDSDASKFIEYKKQPPIRLNFVSGGTVNGYYDYCDDALRERGPELLNNAKADYFDVVGQYSHLIFPTDELRRYSGGDLKGLIEAYDRLMYDELEFMGCMKYPERMFANRMLFVADYNSDLLYSSNYRTAYPNVSGMCNPESFAAGVWGPAHEVGHHNQTRPGLKWIGMTECTNNIMSEYVQTVSFNRDSRLQIQSAPNNGYVNQWTNMIKGLPHCECGIWGGLVPFWQLELYFGRCLGLTPKLRNDHGGLYPEIHEYLRTHDNQPDGECQANFAYIASYYAGMDLTEFFERHGFLTVVDKEITDMATRYLTVTQEYADDVRARIKALKLPKPEIPIWYITDNNWKYVKNKATIKQGSTAYKFGNTVDLYDWENVMVFEVTDANGNLVHVADASYPFDASKKFCEFTLPNGVERDNITIWAVQYDGKRIEVR